MVGSVGGVGLVLFWKPCWKEKVRILCGIGRSWGAGVVVYTAGVVLCRMPKKRLSRKHGQFKLWFIPSS